MASTVTFPEESVKKEKQDDHIPRVIEQEKTKSSKWTLRRARQKSDFRASNFSQKIPG